MSLAYQYGVETTAQPAASANVSAPEELCSLFAYGVTKTSVAASRSASSSIVEEAVVEHDVLGEIEVGDPPLQHQAVLLASAPRDLRMRAAGDHVENVGMLLDDRRQRVEHHLDSLARARAGRTWRAGTSIRCPRSRRGGRHVARPATARRARRARARARSARRAGRRRSSRPRRRRPGPASCCAVSVITITRSSFVTERGQHLSWCARRLGENRVQRHNERLRELARRTRARTRRPDRRRSRTRAAAGRRRRPCARAPARRERSRRAPPWEAVRRISGRCGLEGSSITTSWLTSSTPGTSSSSSPDVEGESADPARAGWERRKDRGTHVLCAPFARSPRLARTNASWIGWPPA